VKEQQNVHTVKYHDGNQTLLAEFFPDIVRID